LITSLKISNYALIEHLDIAFDKGMTCITGETGAGKSILMGGLALVLGKRADLSALKDNNKKCIVEASFLINNYNLKHFFEELELDYEEETILRREIIPSGKSRAFINDTPVTLDVVGRLSAALIDIHSQLENQSLFRNEYQFLVLDALAGNSNILVKYKEQLQYYQETLGELNRLKGVREDAAKIQDYNQFLYNELLLLI
jgi:DNA repair protein RecN (Recombination protein N)